MHICYNMNASYIHKWFDNCIDIVIDHCSNSSNVSDADIDVNANANVKVNADFMSGFKLETKAAFEDVLKSYRDSIRAIVSNKRIYEAQSGIALCLIKLGFIIFGGFIRDRILHNWAAKEFSHRNKFKTDEFFCKYNDPTICSDLKDRLLIANDIDVMMHISKWTGIDTFVSTMRCNGYIIEKYKRIETAELFSKAYKEGVYSCIAIDSNRFLLSEAFKITFRDGVNVDLIIVSNAENKLMNASSFTAEAFLRDCADFDVNSFWIEQNRCGKALGVDNHTKYIEVRQLDMNVLFSGFIEHLKPRLMVSREIKSRSYSNILSTQHMAYRLVKMLKKGWNVQNLQCCDSNGTCAVCYQKKANEVRFGTCNFKQAVCLDCFDKILKESVKKSGHLVCPFSKKVISF